MANRKIAGPRLNTETAKRRFLELVHEGKTHTQACSRIGRSIKSYDYWRKNDETFRNQVDAIHEMRDRRAEDQRDDVGEFAQFREEYLGSKTFRHQLQWVDLLEGREPRDLHPSMVYEPAKKTRLLINTPPNHAKSTIITVDYVTYRICKDPGVRIIIISKTQDQAKKFLYSVKQRLTHPRYMKLQAAFAPSEGFKAAADQWTATQIYLQRDSSEKDPTVEALGLGGQVYGARADLIVCDDVVTLKNAHEYEKQMEWIRQEVASRLGPNGRLLVVGTRVSAIDLYRELRNPEHYTSGISPYTYFAQPALLEQSEDPDKVVTLWPRSDVAFEETDDPQDDDGLYPRWTPARLADVRNELGPRKWSLVYMQAEVEEDAVFSPDIVKRAIDSMRRPGLLVPGLRGHREQGMDGTYVIAGLDPAMVGDTAIVVMAVDRLTRLRWVLDVRIKTSAGARWIRDQIREVTDTYGVHEWRVEKNAFQGFLTQDPEINEWLASQGVVLQEHHTGKNKWDVDFGVASMALLFEQGLLRMPSPGQFEGGKLMIEELITWAPDTKNKTDAVMALWFAEIRAREILRTQVHRSTSYVNNPFLSHAQRREQTVINLSEWSRAAG